MPIYILIDLKPNIDIYENMNINFNRKSISEDNNKNARESYHEMVNIKAILQIKEYQILIISKFNMIISINSSHIYIAYQY